MPSSTVVSKRTLAAVDRSLAVTATKSAMAFFCADEYAAGILIRSVLSLCVNEGQLAVEKRLACEVSEVCGCVEREAHEAEVKAG